MVRSGLRRNDRLVSALLRAMRAPVHSVNLVPLLTTLPTAAFGYVVMLVVSFVPEPCSASCLFCTRSLLLAEA
jgi:cyanate permease